MSKYLKCADVLELWNLVGQEAKEDFKKSIANLSDKDESKVDNLTYKYVINFIFGNYDVPQFDPKKLSSFAKNIRPAFVATHFLDQIVDKAPKHLPFMVTVFEDFKSNAVIKKLSNLIVRTEHLFPDFEALNFKILINMAKFEKVIGTDLIVERLSTSTASESNYSVVAEEIAKKAGYKDAYHDWVKETKHTKAIGLLPDKQLKGGKNPLMNAYKIKIKKPVVSSPKTVASTDVQISGIRHVLAGLRIKPDEL